MSVDFLTMAILVLIVGLIIYAIDAFIDKMRKDRMPWYYWVIGIVVFLVIEITIDKSYIIQTTELTPNKALLAATFYPTIITIIYAILVFGLMSLVWKLRLKSKQKKSENTNAEKQERRYKQ